MYFSYGLWNNILKSLPKNLISNTDKYNNLNKLILQNKISKDLPFIFLKFSNGDQKLQDNLFKNGYNLFPNVSFSQFIRDRNFYLKEIDKFIKYPLKRLYFDNVSNIDLNYVFDYFGDSDIVMKLGNFHASECKWLIQNRNDFPSLKYKYRNLPVTFEEFVPNGRSIRIGLIGDANNFDNYFICEHVNSTTWLKNFNPEEELVYSYKDRHLLNIEYINDLFLEVQNIALKYGANLLGIDWIISESKVGLLELNDMIGLPEDDFTYNLFLREIKKVLFLD